MSRERPSRPSRADVARSLRHLELLHGRPPDPGRDNARMAAGVSEQQEQESDDTHDTTSSARHKMRIAKRAFTAACADALAGLPGAEAACRDALLLIEEARAEIARLGEER